MLPPEGRSAIENEAGQRAGAVNGTRLRSQRPAEPTVTDFSGFWIFRIYGAVFVLFRARTEPYLGKISEIPVFLTVPYKQGRAVLYPENGRSRAADGIEIYFYSRWTLPGHYGNVSC